MIFDKNILEEELKIKVGEAFFGDFDSTIKLGKIDFCVNDKGDIPLAEMEFYLWAEAKKGVADEIMSLSQLVLTVGKARAFDTYLPPRYLGAFDAEKIVFVEYNKVQDIFYKNDFNWNVTSSNTGTREFEQIMGLVKSAIKGQKLVFEFGLDEGELREFIRENFVRGGGETSKVRITKNNFLSIYNKWLVEVQPSIAVDWEVLKKVQIIDADFYLADILSKENSTITDRLSVVLKKNIYEANKKYEYGMFTSSKVEFNDGQKSHSKFWNKYERPPKEEFWEFMMERRDMLVPQDIRERKGSYFTPQIWVELSQKYMADYFGENYQEEYYIWDCAAGTGNLLAGLTNKYNIFASTLDQADVDVMKERIANGANLLEGHVFRFDFLNDEFSKEKLPSDLFEIINNPEKRKRLIVYINPPYAEAGNARQKAKTGENKDGVSTGNKTYEKYKDVIKNASNEIFSQFLIRIYKEIPEAKIGNFSTLKILMSSNFKDFREEFKAKLERLFIVPANTFDNVRGDFPIAFYIWNSEKEQIFKKGKCDIFDKEGKRIGVKKIKAAKKLLSSFGKINVVEEPIIGHFASRGTDFQNQNSVFVDSVLSDYKGGGTHSLITFDNIVLIGINFSVRHCIKSTWVNDRDQFLYPKKSWEGDKEFQWDCLAYMLFHGQNRVSRKVSFNYSIPFSEKEVDAPMLFENNFMLKFFDGIIPKGTNGKQTKMFKEWKNGEVIEFSNEARRVFDKGREVWRYYFAKLKERGGVASVEEVNASLYDIREYFQGRDDNDRMKNKSEDETYNKMMEELRGELKKLGRKIEVGVYEHGFLEV